MLDKTHIWSEKFLTYFTIGDMVSWKYLGEQKQYGIIVNIEVVEIKSRNIAIAKVRTSDEKTIEMMLQRLYLESKVKRCEETNNIQK